MPRSIDIYRALSATDQERVTARLSRHDITVAIEDVRADDLAWALKQEGLMAERPARSAAPRAATARQIAYARSLIERARRSGDHSDWTGFTPADLARMTTADVSAIIDNLR